MDFGGDKFHLGIEEESGIKCVPKGAMKKKKKCLNELLPSGGVEVQETCIYSVTATEQLPKVSFIAFQLLLLLLSLVICVGGKRLIDIS